MKHARLLFPMFLLFTLPISGQIEHAATPEQCRADADSWSLPKAAILVPNEQQFSQTTNIIARDRSVSAKILNARIAELQQCIKTDSVQSTRYAEGSRAYAIALLIRISSFVQRDNLTPQFYQEDEQGKR
jgi:hypothetical protein